MNFKEIIKQEWEEEFNPGEYEKPVEPYGFESSVFQMYNSMVERICVRVWNQALDIALDNVEVICDSSETFQSIDQQSILKFKIDEQRTDTTGT